MTFSLIECYYYQSIVSIVYSSSHVNLAKCSATDIDFSLLPRHTQDNIIFVKMIFMIGSVILNHPLVDKLQLIIISNNYSSRKMRGGERDFGKLEEFQLEFVLDTEHGRSRIAIV